MPSTTARIADRAASDGAEAADGELLGVLGQRPDIGRHDRRRHSVADVIARGRIGDRRLQLDEVARCGCGAGKHQMRARQQRRALVELGKEADRELGCGAEIVRSAIGQRRFDTGSLSPAMAFAAAAKLPRTPSVGTKPVTVTRP